MSTGYTRQASANIASGLTIRSADINAEFNALQTAFDATSGHAHDGTTGEGPKIVLSGTGVGVTGTLDVAKGGTGATTASAARTALGLAIGSDVQAYDAGLTSIAGLTTSADKMIYTTGSDIYAVTALTAAGRALLDDASASAQRTTLGLVIGTDVQAYDAGLADIAGLAVTDGNFIVGDGSNWVAESGSTARTSLGLGSIATQSAGSVSITGGSITGLTTLSGTVNPTFTSTDAGATVGPLLTLHRNSASPAASDIIGGINFDGEDSVSTKTTFAQIQVVITDPTNGTEDGVIDFYAMSSGTLNRAIRIDGSSLTVRSTSGTGSDPTLIFEDDAGPTAQWKIRVDESDSNKLVFQSNTTGDSMWLTQNGGMVLKVFSDSTRPAATAVPAGTIIYNSTDNAINTSNGTNWYMNGVVT